MNSVVTFVFICLVSFVILYLFRTEEKEFRITKITKEDKGHDGPA